MSEKIHIPSSEINLTDLHADELGFVFVWKGHLLRGIYEQSVPQAEGYFSSGFLDEIVEKGLFPKTWISDFENEQFGLILEHEMIYPVLYATEWNFLMLKDAALMVLEIAEIGHRYGYNMIDCHKKNVLFKNNTPMYVDLGSFVPNAPDSKVWNPYSSFLRSYYYILEIWHSGAAQLAKRVMSPGVELQKEDYYSFKYPVLRSLPRVRKFIMKIGGIFESIDRYSLTREPRGVRYIALSTIKFVRSLNPLHVNYWHFGRMKKRIRGMKPLYKALPLKEKEIDLAFERYINSALARESVKTVEFVDIPNYSLVARLTCQWTKKTFLSLNQQEAVSEREYGHVCGGGYSRYATSCLTAM